MLRLSWIDSSRRPLALIALLLLARLLGPAEVATADADSAQLEVDEMLTFVNESRAEEGVAPVTLDPTLERVAQERAATLAEQPGTLSHQEPDGQLAFAHLLSEANADCWLAGENLARGEDGEDLAARLHARLMESGPHRANIVDGAFNAAGIGLARDADGWVVLTEIFCAH